MHTVNRTRSVGRLVCFCVCGVPEQNKVLAHRARLRFNERNNKFLLTEA